MNLIRTYSKIIINKNYYKYLLVILSIIVSYLLIAVTTVFIDNIMLLSAEPVYSEMRYINISILTIFLLGGLSLIIYQYYYIIKSSMRDYCILRGLGATKGNIRLLILIQVIFLMIISLPVGLLSGYLLTEAVINLIVGCPENLLMLEKITSITALYLAAIVIGSFIIFIGVYLDLGVRKMSLDNIISDSILIGREV